MSKGLAIFRLSNIQTDKCKDFWMLKFKTQPDVLNAELNFPHNQ